MAKTQQDHPVYAAMIESVDEGVGKMIQTLKELRYGAWHERSVREARRCPQQGCSEDDRLR